MRGDRSRPRLLGTAGRLIGLTGQRLARFRPGGGGGFDHGGTRHDSGGDRPAPVATGSQLLEFVPALSIGG